MRQNLATARCLASNQPESTVQPTKDVKPYGKQSATSSTPSASKFKHGERHALCCPQLSDYTPLYCIETTPTPSELCTCVSVLNESPSTFSNQQLVFLSVPLQEADPLLPPSKRGKAAAELPAPVEHTVARLDTGASCHDFVSQQVAEGLIAAGAEQKAVSGRVCSAFRAVGRNLESSITCNYKFLNILF